jgi:hypothetical protein
VDDCIPEAENNLPSVSSRPMALIDPQPRLANDRSWEHDLAEPWDRRSGGLLFGFILPLVAFYIFTSIFSDGAEKQARWKVVTLSVSAMLLLFFVSTSMPTPLGLTIACLAAALVSLFGLVFWIKVTRSQALKITGSYMGFVIGYNLLFGLMIGFHRPV